MTRIQSVLPSSINEEQSYYNKGQYIGQNIGILEDIFFTKHNNLRGILLSMDFEKAFDSFKCNFSFKTLEHVNLGNNVINYVKTLNTNIQPTVINNGSTSRWIKLQRGGVRQGCPLSAYYL